MASTGTAPREARPSGGTGFGPFIKRLRRQAGLSQRALAERLRIDVTYLSKLENGRQSGSDRVVRALAEQLDVPAAELLRLAGRVPDEIKLAFGPELVELMRPATVPRYRTSFVNRAVEAAHFRRAWRPGALVTITGPPGCGKTRMAAELVSQLATQGTTVTWLEVREGDDVGRLTARLDASDVGSAIVLNDADFALPAATGLVRQLLDGSPDVAVLVTSRQRLGVRGEQLLPLAGLPIPDLHLRPSPVGPGLTPDFVRLELQESVHLFVDRAMLASPDFQLDLRNATAVFDVCRWLDGLPLAIELAALRLRQMTVADLAAELDDLLPWLGGNTADVPERHSSLDAAIEWSFRQLSDEERTVATRLCSFSAPFRMGDAAEVAHDEHIPLKRVNEAVLELIDRSLLVKLTDQELRAVYRWPNAVREYGRRELERGPDAARAQERYTSWCMRIVEALHTDPVRSEAEWTRVAALSPDLFAAIHRLPTEEQHEAVSRLAGAHSTLLMLGHGSRQIEELERRPGSRPNVFREAGIAARVKGEWETAEEYLQIAHQAAVNQRDLVGQANTLRDLAENAADQDKHDEARESATRAGALYQDLEDANGQLEVKNLLGKLLLETGDPLGAEQALEEALQDAAKLEDRRLEAYSLHNLGLCDHALRRLASARDRLGRSLDIRLAMGNLRGLARLFESFAVIESVLENHTAALQLCGAAAQIRRSLELRGMPPRLQARLERVEADARVALAEMPDEADRLLRRGASMSLGAAAELALRDVAAIFREPLEAPLSEVLRRRAPDGCRLVAGDRNGSGAETPLSTALDQLAAGAGSVPDVHRHLLAAELLVLGEPIDARIHDFSCFAVRPDLHRGILLPAFSSRAALDEARRLRPEWAAKPVLTLRFDQLRSVLVAGETIVVDPWLVSEYRFSLAEPGYQPQSPVSTSV